VGGIPAAPIVALSRPFEDPVPSDLASGRIDLVTLMFNYHDLGHLGVDRAAMLSGGFTHEAASKIARGNCMRIFRAAVG
jgi:hypothetical protein